MSLWLSQYDAIIHKDQIYKVHEWNGIYMFNITSICHHNDRINGFAAKECNTGPYHDSISINKKANLRDLIAATGLTILLKLARMTLKFDGWPPKTIGYAFYATSSFVRHFKHISEFKLELQSGNDQFRSQLVIFLSRVTLKFDGWPCKKIGHLFHITSSFVHHSIAIGECTLELQSGNVHCAWP